MPRARRDSDLYNAGWTKPKAPARPRPIVERPILSPREVEVLGLLASGLTRVQVAERLVIADGTIRQHCKKIHEKLDVRTNAQAVAEGIRRGLIA